MGIYIFLLVCLLFEFENVLYILNNDELLTCDVVKIFYMGTFNFA